jgi:DNA-binding transcriptional LysR family regulator
MYSGEMVNTPNLTIQQLEYVVAAADASTWSEAATELGVSQSALSQGLAELQRRLGVELFERDGRRRVLRPVAVEVVDYARRVLAQTNDLGRWAEGVRTGTSGRLRVGMIDAAAIHYFAQSLRSFREDRPEVTLHLTVAPSGQLLELVRSGDLDLAVGVRPRDATRGIDLDHLMVEELSLYAPGGAKAGAADQWGPWVTFPPESHTRLAVARAMRSVGADFDVVAESNQPDVLKEMVLLGMGWTVLPSVQAESGDRPLRRARKDPVAERELVLFRRSHRTPDPMADHFVKQLMSEAA